MRCDLGCNDRLEGGLELRQPVDGIRSQVTVADGKLDQPGALRGTNEAARFVDRTDAIFHTVQRDPGSRQLRRWQQMVAALDLRVFQSLHLAQRLAQIQVDTE